MSETVAWWHCFAGIAGDMALGSLVDAGAPLDQVERELATLPVGGWSLEARPVLRGGVACTQVDVAVRESSVVRTHAHIVGLITEARLPPRARQRALDTFALLAQVEGQLHRRAPAQVHFHEVGGVDAIVDIVGTCVALELLGVDQVRASPVAQGTGMVRSAHGLLPNPVPAVVSLLQGAPTYGTEFPFGFTTPTGAALLAALGSGWGPMPAMEVTASGFGAGTRELDGMPNAVQVVIGQLLATETSSEAGLAPGAGAVWGASPAGLAAGSGQPVVLLSTNVDDVTGEVLAHLVSALLAAGAYDAWLVPVVGKKGRPAQVVEALVDPAHAARLRALVVAETGSLGVRWQRLERWVAARSLVEVHVDGYPVRVKTSEARAKAEHEDVVKVAARTGRPAREVARLAEEEAYRLPPGS